MNRFSSDKPIIRANAAIRLAEMAETHRPGTERDFTPENNPFFSRATSQLAAALHIETEEDVRAEVVKALKRMMTFARKNKSESLQHLLVNELADTNRAAKKAFLKSLAGYLVYVIPRETWEEKHWEDIVSLAPFCRNAEDTRICLGSLFKSEEYKAFVPEHQAVRSTQTGDEAAAAQKAYLVQLHTKAVLLMETRDALGTALKALLPPQDLPDTLAAWEEWKRPIRLALLECFLAGSYLDRAHLQGASLRGAYLQGASLSGAQLQKANFRLAKLQSIKLTEAYLEKAFFDGAQMQNSYLGGAYLQEASLINVCLKGAHLDEAQLQGASFWFAEVQTASFYGARLDSTHLSGIKYEEGTDEEHRYADFENANWWDANFINHNGNEDTNVKGWLQTNFPKPETGIIGEAEAVVEVYQRKTEEETLQAVQNVGGNQSGNV